MSRWLRFGAVLCIVGLLLTWTVASPTATAQAKKFKIGLVYDVGGRGDKSFNDMAAAGFIYHGIGRPSLAGQERKARK